MFVNIVPSDQIIGTGDRVRLCRSAAKVATRAPSIARYNGVNMAKKLAEKEPSFEAGLAELEKIVEELEDGELPLEKSLTLFEKGVKLSDSCRKQLQEAESKVEILLKKEGRVEAEAFTLTDDEPEG